MLSYQNLIEKDYPSFLDLIFGAQEEEFSSLSLAVFAHQFKRNPLYGAFSELLGKSPYKTTSIEEIPFPPISFFKSHIVITHSPSLHHAPLIFGSSGTTGSVRSLHHVTDEAVYKTSLLRSFQLLMGEITHFNIFALLPSYMERDDASLVYMVKTLMDASGSTLGGFFLDDFLSLQKDLEKSLQSQRETLLIGVSFALLDFGRQLSDALPGLMVVETGGMKGMQREMVREELHDHLKKYFGVATVYSEYGMTELCSQAWSHSNGIYTCPPWMKVIIRDLYDPFTFLPHGKTGGVNIIDLANINSCAFIATSDIGKSRPDGSFEILGRTDGSEARGCNLMAY